MAFDDSFEELPQKISDNSISEPKQLHEGRLPVQFSKWKHLQELKPVLDPLSHNFYDCIPHLEATAKIDTEHEKLEKIMQKVHLVKKTPKPKVVNKTKGRKATKKMIQPKKK